MANAIAFETLVRVPSQKPMDSDTDDSSGDSDYNIIFQRFSPGITLKSIMIVDLRHISNLNSYSVGILNLQHSLSSFGKVLFDS